MFADYLYFYPFKSIELNYQYLSTFSCSAYKAAEQDDLWEYFTAQAHLDKTIPADVTIKTIMDTWTLQMGFPVVSVTRDYTSNEATLIQVGLMNI